MSTIFEAGFQEFLQNGLFSDIILKNGQRRFAAHKLILVFSSQYFDRMFSNWTEKNQKIIELKYPDPRDVFPAIMQFMYCGKLDLTWDRIVPLLDHADYYGIQSLCELCHSFIRAHLKRKTVLSLLKDAIEFKKQDLVDKCVKLVVSNFLHLHKSDFSWMDPTVFLQLLSHRGLAVREEWPLFQAIVRYIEVNEKKLEEETIENLMGTVRFRWMSYEQLIQVRNNPSVPRSLIVEALMAKLGELEPDRKPTGYSPLRLQPRVMRGIEFEYNPKQPKYGIIAWLATNFNQNEWQNLCSSGHIKVTASSIERGQEKILLDPEENELWTCDVPSSWFCIDLQQWSVIPSYYTLRHGGNYSADSLRNWDLQGSVDGASWTTLRRHYKDDSISGKFSMCTWPIKYLDTPKPYRFFRILQTGHNGSNRNFLVLSFFELYGALWETEEARVEFGNT